MEPSAELSRLREVVRDLESAVIAFSGGIDSALVLKVATEELGSRALGLTAVGPALALSERKDAARIAAEIGARHRMVDSSEIDDPDYRKNGPDRCYHCKSELYRITESMRLELDFAWVVNGSNKDDLGDYRPGLTAADEARVRSPLVEAELDKAGVRAVARELALNVWDKPASACLASRIPYGTEVTPQRLSQVGQFEAALRELGLRQVRVRHHERLARVEVAVEELPRAFELRAAIVAAGRQAGYTYVTLDLGGYRQGSLNAVLPVLP